MIRLLKTKNQKMIFFRVCGVSIGFSVPNKKRSMWITSRKRFRMDHFVSIHRAYNRDYRRYLWTIILFKLNITVMQ